MQKRNYITFITTVLIWLLVAELGVLLLIAFLGRVSSLFLDLLGAIEQKKELDNETRQLDACLRQIIQIGQPAEGVKLTIIFSLLFNQQ